MSLICPAGLYYCPDFLSKDELAHLTRLYDEKHANWTQVTNKSKKSRRVIQYGYEYSYQSKGYAELKEIDAIPDYFSPIVKRLATEFYAREKKSRDSDAKNSRDGGEKNEHDGDAKNAHGSDCKKQFDFGQLIINEYYPGQGIAPHIDHIKRFGPIVACISLGSGIVMDFEKITPASAGSEAVVEKYSIYVKPRSLYFMSGDARYKWKHSIASRKTDVVDAKKIKRGRRVSLTFRSTLF